MERIKKSFQKAMGKGEALLAALEACAYVRAALFLGLFAMMTTSVYLLNVHTPLFLDDFDFMISWATGEPLAGFADVVRSQMVHYRIWGGRLLHVFTQSFLYLGKDVFNVANTAMFMLLLLEVYVIAKPKRSFCWTLLLAEYLVMMTMVPFFGTVFLWLTGSCIYLWGTVLALLPVVVIRSIAQGGWMARGKVRSLICLPLGVLAGWTNENTACGMIALVFVYIALEYMKRRKLRGRMVLLFAGQCIGTLLLLLAPGNFSRASSYTYDSMLMELLRRFVMVTAYGVVYLGVLLAAIVLLGAGLRERIARGGQAALLLFGAFMSVYAMVGSPELSDRTYTGAFVLVLAACLTLLGDAEEHVRAFDAAKIVVLPLLLVTALYVSYQALGDVSAFEARWNTQIEVIELACAEGASEAKVESVYAVSRFTMDAEFPQDPAQWPNTSISKVYGIDVSGK